jgi:O-antigen ligase
MAEPGLDIVFSSAFILACAIFILKRFTPVKKTVFFSTTSLFFLAVFLSVTLSQNKDKSLLAFYPYATYLFCFIAISYFNAKEYNLLIKTLIISSALVSFCALKFLTVELLYTISYLKTTPSPINAFALEYLSRGRSFVPFPTPTALAGYLILFAPLSFALLFKNPKKQNNPVSLTNILTLFIFLGISLALLSTQSLGALISLAIAATLFIFQKKYAFKKNTVLLTALFLGITLISIFYLRQRETLIFNQPQFSITNRMLYWHEAVKNIFQHPWLGFGLGNYPHHKTIAAHNTYLQLWIETGILGFITFLALAAQIYKKGFKESFKENNALFFALWTGSSAFLIHNACDFTFFYPEITLQWWAIVALLLNQPSNPTDPIKEN